MRLVFPALPTAATLTRDSPGREYPQARPWRMTSEQYRSAGGAGPPLLGTPAATPWDPALADAMRRAGRAVMEERLLDRLLGDLAS